MWASFWWRKGYYTRCVINGKGSILIDGTRFVVAVSASLGVVTLKQGARVHLT
jgi:hypothetical protein